MSPEERRARKEAREAERARLEEIRRAEAAEWVLQAAEAERQKWLPRTYRIMNRGMIDVPVWEDHGLRGKNWGAIVEVDPTAPGGLRRFWFNRGRGVAKYIVPEQLQVGHTVEFGADYITSVGRRKPDRFYGVVVGLSEVEMVLQPYADVVAAISHRSVRVG